MTATAGDPIFMFIKGINGESTDRGHPKWIVVNGYQTSFSRSCSTCLVQLGPFTVTMPYSLASPPLLADLFANRVLPTVEIQLATISRTGRELNYLTITLTNVLLSSLNDSSSGGRPVESLTLAPAKYCASYTTGTGSPEVACSLPT